ncbi:unnamed protein product [Amoebophrya sp. A120]|nr:unnamed protein product [Amoebophrya sp. A120]|eukprot:GSA120T00000083001.1
MIHKDENHNRTLAGFLFSFFPFSRFCYLGSPEHMTPVSLVDQYGKSAGLLKDEKRSGKLYFKALDLLLQRYLHQEGEPPMMKGVEAATRSSSPRKATTTWERAQALVEAAHSRIFSNPTVDPHEERLFRELDAQFDAEERLAEGLGDVDPTLLENPPPGALVRPVSALFDLDEVDSDGRRTGLRGRWNRQTNADPFLLRFTPDLDVPHLQYAMVNVTHSSELFLQPKHSTKPSSLPARKRTLELDSLYNLRDIMPIAAASQFATSADRAVFEAPPGLHNMCVESCALYMWEYVNGHFADTPDDAADDPIFRVFLRARGALVRYAEDPDYPGAVSKVGFFGDPDAVAEVLHARWQGD